MNLLKIYLRLIKSNIRAPVLGTCEEVENLLFLGDDTSLLFATVGKALGTKYGLPVFRPDLDVVLYRR